jgi:RNA recognition motif-containing protein
MQFLTDFELGSKLDRGVNSSFPVNSFESSSVEGSLFLSELPSDVTDKEIKELFIDYGKLKEIVLKKEDIMNYAFIIFENVVDALAAIRDFENEDDAHIMGEPLRLSWASPMSASPLFVPNSMQEKIDYTVPPIQVLFSFISSQVRNKKYHCVNILIVVSVD